MCNIIENSINNNSKYHKIDKKQLAVDILQPPFNLNPSEIQQLKDQIDFLYNNNQIVKLSGFKKTLNGVSGWFKKKVQLS